MKIWIISNVRKELTDNYHDGGALAVVAIDEANARLAVRNHIDGRTGPTDEEWDTAVVYELAGSPEPRVFIFPDAGCC